MSHNRLRPPAGADALERAPDDDRVRLRADLAARLASGDGWSLLAIEVGARPWAETGCYCAIDAWAADVAAHGPGGRPPYRVGELRFAFLVPPQAHALDRGPAELRAAVLHTITAHGLSAVQAEVRLGDEGETVDAVLHRVERTLRERWERQELSARRQVRSALLALLDEYRGHTPDAVRRAAGFAIVVARRLGVPEDEHEDVVRAAELQEIGKVALPQAILDRNGPLTDAELRVVRGHPAIGERIVGSAPALSAAARLIRSSCERFDGSGYPDGLAGAEIPLGSRIIAVSTAFAAMLSGRAYRPALTWREAAAQLRAARGTQFDPQVVDAFLDVVGDDSLAS
jgi:two-component system, cell cycle response regulator